MTTRTRLAWLLTALLVPFLLPAPAGACCAVFPPGSPVVNADQTVIILWDAASKTEHFIRQASFKSDADDFGFLIPTPAQPELSESGNEAFPFLFDLTERWGSPSPGFGCSMAPTWYAGERPAVRVLEEKRVAGFNAVVLEADSANALAGWLKEHGYAFSPEVEAWARPYVAAGWKITALRVARNKDDKRDQDVAASALHMTFKTDRPLFPYREPDPKAAAAALGARERLLRIYFIADARYRGELTKKVPWTGRAVWSNQVSDQNRAAALELLKLPGSAGPAHWWLTEFEDHWPYRVAPADVYFSRDPDQAVVRADDASPTGPDEVTFYALTAAVALPLLRLTRRPRGKADRNNGV